MAAPSPTARGTPGGRMLENGHQTLITLSRVPTAKFWEIDPKPPTLDMGGAIDITTQHNVRARTKAPKDLIDFGDAQVTVAWDPKFVDDLIDDHMGIDQTITWEFPDGSTEAHFGFVDKFDRAALKEGEFPQATMTIVLSNRDSSGVEQLPVVTEVAGT